MLPSSHDSLNKASERLKIKVDFNDPALIAPMSTVPEEEAKDRWPAMGRDDTYDSTEQSLEPGQVLESRKSPSHGLSYALLKPSEQ